MLSQTTALTRACILIVNTVVINNLHVMSNPIVTFHLSISMLEAQIRISRKLRSILISFKIIAISETWTELNTTEDILLNGYMKFFHVTRANRKGGGVELFINHRFNCTLPTAKSFEIENLFECVTINLDMQKHKTIIVNCVYRTPGLDIPYRFCEHMDQLLVPTRVKANFFTW